MTRCSTDNRTLEKMKEKQCENQAVADTGVEIASENWVSMPDFMSQAVSDFRGLGDWVSTR